MSGIQAQATATISRTDGLEREIDERPEVLEVEHHQCRDRKRYLVTFKGWGMPSGFPEDYGLEVDEFYLRDPRPRWKRLLNWGFPVRLEVSFVKERDGLDLEDELGT